MEKKKVERRLKLISIFYYLVIVSMLVLSFLEVGLFLDDKPYQRSFFDAVYESYAWSYLSALGGILGSLLSILTIFISLEDPNLMEAISQFVSAVFLSFVMYNFSKRKDWARGVLAVVSFVGFLFGGFITLFGTLFFLELRLDYFLGLVPNLLILVLYLIAGIYLMKQDVKRVFSKN